MKQVLTLQSPWKCLQDPKESAGNTLESVLRTPVIKELTNNMSKNLFLTAHAQRKKLYLCVCIYVYVH